MEIEVEPAGGRVANADAAVRIIVRQPQVKGEHAPYRFRGNRINIRRQAHGIAAGIDYPASLEWTHQESRGRYCDPEARVETVVRLHPAQSHEAVDVGPDRPIVQGYAEDAAALDAAMRRSQMRIVALAIPSEYGRRCSS
jgi:hypothetical protein